MGLTGGVKSHRLSGQISPYCEKKTSLALRVLRAYVFRIRRRSTFFCAFLLILNRRSAAVLPCEIEFLPLNLTFQGTLG